MVSVKAQFDRRRVRTACGKNKDRAAKGFSGVYGTNGIEQRTQWRHEAFRANRDRAFLSSSSNAKPTQLNHNAGSCIGRRASFQFFSTKNRNWCGRNFTPPVPETFAMVDGRWSVSR